MPLTACPDCSREISALAPACVHCGRPMQPAAAAPPAACPLCSTAVVHENAGRGGVVFCRCCGARLEYRPGGVLDAFTPRPQAVSLPAPPADPPARMVVLGPRKSVGLAVLLALLFGPLGMLYSTVPGAILFLVIDVLTLGFGIFLTWPLGVLWAALAAHAQNDRNVAWRF